MRWTPNVSHLPAYHYQTDPNWGNFLYEEAPSAPASDRGTSGNGTLHLIDFGAAREFPPDFVRDYLEMVKVIMIMGICSTERGGVTRRGVKRPLQIVSPPQALGMISDHNYCHMKLCCVNTDGPQVCMLKQPPSAHSPLLPG